MKQPRQGDYVRYGQKWAQVASIETVGKTQCARLVGSVGRMTVPLSDIVYKDGRFELIKK